MSPQPLRFLMLHMIGLRAVLVVVFSVARVPLASGDRLQRLQLQQEQGSFENGQSHPAGRSGNCPIDTETLNSLKRGPPGGALIPALVPPPGYTFQFKIWETVRIVQVNTYQWYFDGVKAKAGRESWKFNQQLVRTEGTQQSNSWGHKSFQVIGMDQEELFTISTAKNHNKLLDKLNPLRLRWSFRILPPGAKSDEDALFTINRDFFGKGYLWKKEEWRIYHGQAKHEDMIYYGIRQDKLDFNFYRSRSAYKAGDKKVYATLEQQWKNPQFVNRQDLPVKFKLEVEPGEDAALLLAVATIIEMVSGKNEHLDEQED